MKAGRPFHPDECKRSIREASQLRNHGSKQSRLRALQPCRHVCLCAACATACTSQLAGLSPSPWTMQETGSWQEVLRALCAVEAVVQQGSTASCGEIAVHFQVGQFSGSSATCAMPRPRRLLCCGAHSIWALSNMCTGAAYLPIKPQPGGSCLLWLRSPAGRPC